MEMVHRSSRRSHSPHDGEDRQFLPRSFFLLPRLSSATEKDVHQIHAFEERGKPRNFHGGNYASDRMGISCRTKLDKARCLMCLAS